MIRIFSARDSIEANIVKGMLEANDIPAYIEGEYLQGGIGELAAIDYVFVCVDNENEVQAACLVSEYETGQYSKQI